MSESIKKIEELLSLESGTIEKLVKGEEEVNVDVSGIVVRNSEQEAQLTESINKKTEERYLAGLETGEKRAVNKALEGFGLSLDKAKTLDNFIPVFKEHLTNELSLNPDKKVVELENTVNKLRSNYETLENEYTTFKTTQAEKENKATQRANLLNSIPDNDNYILPKDKLLLLAESEHKFTYDENNVPWPVDASGEMLKDEKTLRPIPASQFLAENFTPNYLGSAGGGAGKGDEFSNTKGGYDEFVQEMEQSGHNIGSEAFQKEAAKRQKDGTLKM